MVLIRKIIGAVGVISAVTFAASYWEVIHISSALEKGVMICFVIALLADTAIDWTIGKKAQV